MEPWRLDALSMAALVRDKKISAREIAQAHLARIDRVNPKLNAIVRRMDEEALAAADAVDAGKRSGPLAGATATSKINTDHIGYPSDNGLVLEKDHMPTGTNPTLAGLLDGGCVFTGRTNAPAMAMRLHTGNVLHGETLNPFDPTLTPGGSSGGAGVAVATGMCAIAQGNDIAGSIRWPAFCNGVYGLRPTMGRMTVLSSDPTAPRPFGAQLMATNGPLARSVADVRAAFHAMCVPVWEDSTWAPVPLEFPVPAGPLRVALVIDDGLPMHDVTRAAIRRAGKQLEDAGYVVEEARPPMLDELFGLWGRLGSGAVRLFLGAMLPAFADPGLTAFVSSWMELLPPATIEGQEQALLEREVIARTWSAFFDTYPIIVLPTYTRPSMRANEDMEGVDAVRGMLEASRYLLGVPTLGIPALAVPIGGDGTLPHGVQIVARRWRDDLCLSAGAEIERREGPRPVVDPA